MSNNKYRILDNLYGFIYLNENEHEVINSVFFQRLRKIKQLGTADLVFPGTQHTRFSHSLGVLELANRIFQRLITKEINAVSQEDLKRDCKNLRMASLLHDIGHYPLSHTLEQAYVKYDKQYISSNSEKLTELEKKYPSLSIQGKRMDHEYIALRIILSNYFEALHDYGFTDEDISDIGNSIVGDKTIKMYYRQILHSDLDIDSLDYCIRDSDAAGIAYGKYDVNYLFDNVDIKSFNGKPVFGFSEKAIHAIEHFLLARYFYYLQILYHPKRWFFEDTATRFALECIAIGWLPKPDDYLKEIVKEDKNSQYNDALFWYLCNLALQNKKYNNKYPNDKMIIFSKILIERKCPKNYIKEEKRLEIDEIKTSEDVNNFKKQFSKSIHELIPAESTFQLFDFAFKNKDEILNYPFGRLEIDLSILKTHEEAMHSEDPEGKGIQHDRFIVEARDPIRYFKLSDGKPELLANNTNSLAYMLAKNKIGVCIQFESEK